MTLKQSLLTGFGLIMLSLGVHQNALSQNTNVDLSKTSVSGLSSGGYMANQFHLAHSDTVVGAGIIAAGPYYCAQGSIITALNTCVNKVSESFDSTLKSAYLTYEKQQLVAPMSHLSNDKVWLLHGTLDTRIIRPVADALFAQYKGFISANNLTYVNDKEFSHVMPTLDSGGKCEVSESPFIGNCAFDAAGEILKHIYGPLAPRVSAEDALIQGDLISFEQAKLANIDDASMHDTGYAYLPKACADGTSCKVHVSFHGCNQSADNVGMQYASDAGFNQWAANNQIIVLYPQTKKSSILPMNPQACWDWWGYTGDEYATKKGKQIEAVYNMLQNIEQLYTPQ